MLNISRFPHIYIYIYIRYASIGGKLRTTLKKNNIQKKTQYFPEIPHRPNTCRFCICVIWRNLGHPDTFGCILSNVIQNVACGSSM